MQISKSQVRLLSSKYFSSKQLVAQNNQDCSNIILNNYYDTN